MKTLHFALFPSSLHEKLTLHFGSHKFDLQAHTEQTLCAAMDSNLALAAMPAEHRQRFTHFVDVPKQHFPTDRLLRLRVTSPDDDPNIRLPKLHHMSFLIPEEHKRRHLQKKIAAHQPGVLLHPKLHGYGIHSLGAENLSAEALAQHTEDLYMAAEDLNTPWDIACSLLSNSPDLASNKPYTANIVMQDHIAPPQYVDPVQYNKIYNLATVISSQGPASSTKGWATITNSTDQYGNPIQAQYDFGTYKTGDTIEIYNISDKTADACQAPLTGAMQSASNDTSLQNQTWSVNQGATAIQTDANASESLAKSNELLLASSPSNFKWTVKELTPSHGLSVDSGSLSFQDGTFSIDVKNTYLRCLTAYAEFFDENGDVIQNPSGWVDQLPSGISSWFETASKKYITSVSAVNTIMGIPMPTDPTNLKFVFPDEATTLKLLFGGLGTSQWDNDVDVSGALLTGFFEYGIPCLFLAAGAAITSTKFFNDFVSDTDNVVAVLAVAFPIVGGGDATYAALTNTKKALFTLADSMAGMLLQKGLEKLALYITGCITVDELMEEVPFVGWALRIASMAMDVAEMAVTTGEILSSPATLSVEINRAMDLQLTLHPDPAHGEAGHPETAVWPAVSDHYQVTVQYQGGTNFVQKGQMPDVTSSTPLVLTFPNLPVGGQIQIIAGIYSANGWLCGKWQSAWLDAFPDGSTTTKTLDADITEMLVPLTQDTQYLYKEKVIYDPQAQKHVWHAGDLPTATVNNLDCSLTGQSICKPVDITLNGQMFEVAYAWSASGQSYRCQNISVLADPQSRYKLSEVGFTVQPYVAYDQFGTDTDAENQTYSKNNFILDTRNGQFNLRQVNLDDSSTGFGLDDPNLKSWGQFNLPNIDAMVVHPSNAVIAVSWHASKMEILQLPEAPTDDAHAPQAQMVSGLGVREGLLQGPIAMAVTPDGRILILETVNQRIQSFDTKGNPVPSFLGAYLFELPASPYASELDQGIFSSALQQQFETNGVTHIFNLPNSVESELNDGVMTMNLINAFANNGVYLTYDSDDLTNPQVSSYVTVKAKDSSWTITDPNKNAVYTVTNVSGALNVYDVLNNVVIDVRSQGSVWVVSDLNGAQSYYIAVEETDSSKLRVNRYLSYMELYNPDSRTDITYLDVAVEAKGYIYVLSYAGDGKQTSDYSLDLYAPDGTFLVRTPDERLQPTQPQYVSAARLTVDVWRNVYTLNFEAMQGPNNIIEPTISHWIPTPPLFELGLDQQTAFANGDLTTIRQDFAAHGVTLSPSATCQTVNTSGFYEVIDGSTTYDVIRSGSNLEVYSTPLVVNP